MLTERRLRTSRRARLVVHDHGICDPLDAVMLAKFVFQDDSTRLGLWVIEHLLQRIYAGNRHTDVRELLYPERHRLPFHGGLNSCDDFRTMPRAAARRAKASVGTHVLQMGNWTEFTPQVVVRYTD